MCTRPTPSCHSVSASTRALLAAMLASLHALVFLCVAVASAPLRRVWPSDRRRRHPASLAHVDVQVHLGDAACIEELETIVWTTLFRAQRTWSPLALPVDRVVIGAGFPSTGRADIYDDFLAIVDEGAPGDGSPRQRRRVVISLGVREGARDLDGWEIAGALAAQIQALVNERYGQHTSLAAQVPDQRPAAAATTRLTRMPSVAEQQAPVATEATIRNGHQAAIMADGLADPAQGQDVPRLDEHPSLRDTHRGSPLGQATSPRS